ncbi:Sec-independent protein translocase subunit TatA/TatB [Flavobacterium soli]|uniref:Sec-independent protein translocase subunit TatA/TatB n=1 Tax=Flavobacterium soli TaxID=344881 RepID=UPI00041078C0|nr:twin-arginine translocase TatA/TatE family subunit [Flavobacterium soli]
MFGIGGSEIFFIIIVVVMLFGADKVPEIARTLGKGMAQLKNATNDIKSEIQRSAEDSGLDRKTLTGGFTEEIDNVKQGFNKMVGENTPENPLNISSITGDIESEISKAKENIEDMTGPIKRQR